MNSVSDFFSLFFKKDVSISSKTVFVVLVVFAVFFIDDTLGFSFHYSKNKQIEELSLISNVLADKSLNSEVKSKVLDLQKEILNKTSLKDYFFSFLNNNFSTNPNKSGNNALIIDADIQKAIPDTTNTTTNTVSNKIKNSKSDPKVANSSIRNNFWFLISSSGLYILLLTVLVIILLMSEKISLIDKIGVIITIGFTALMVSLFFYWLFGFIPQISDNWVWNYITNSVLQLLILFFGKKYNNAVNKKHRKKKLDAFPEKSKLY